MSRQEPDGPAVGQEAAAVAGPQAVGGPWPPGGPPPAPGPWAASARPPMFLVEPGSIRGDAVVLAGAEGHHAATVRRLSPGERVDLADGSGLVAECVVTSARPGVLELAVRTRRSVPAPDPAVVVVQALPKGERGQLAVELMTEVGVDAIVPWAAERCVARWQGGRADRALARWRAAAREAAKQSRRAVLPEVAALAGTPEVAGLIRSSELAVLLEPAAAVPLAGLRLPRSGRLTLIVGPEGGVAPAEADAFRGAGAVPARLGSTVLRTSTAGVVAASVLLSRIGRWG